ncbi:MAG: hypothetical protein IJ363_00250, partial [Clostridia bacterium]|nr:hypothetical protein [Clostridia bacterium]
MKHLPLLLITALLCLTACTPVSPQFPPPAETVTDTDPAAYLARIAELTDAVLALKQESFIQKAEYEARISALLGEIAALEARLALLDTPDSGTDLPVAGPP